MNQAFTMPPVTKSAASSPLKIALVEDRQKMRANLTRLLATFPEFKCVCECASGEEALKKIPPIQPDIILMDILLPGMSGIECTARIKCLLPDTRILILTASDDEELVFPALEAGADGYLLKLTEPAQLRAALLQLLDGDVPLTSGIARRVARYFRDKARSREQVLHLAPREKEILNLLSKGYSNKEIAGQLSLSIETIHSYLKNVYEKMRVHSRAEAVARYMNSGGG